MKKPSISLCMIAKDEEKYLEQCLNSVKDLVDEMIVIDTGSKDKTKEIAKKFGAKIIGFKWVDNFSQARNESLKHATKDWILVLDADEVLDEEGIEKIKELVAKEGIDAYSLVQKNYTSDSSISGFIAEDGKSEYKYKGWYGSIIVRLFKNKKDYIFKGIVHELIEPSVYSKNGKIAPSGVFIHHYGNIDSKILKKKKKSYLELAKKKAKDSSSADSYFELGVLYKENEDFDEAIKALKKAVDIDKNHELSYFELGIIYEKLKEYDKAIGNYLESNKIKENAEVLSGMGVCYLKKDMLKEAYKSLSRALELSPNRHTIYNNLAVVFEKGNNIDAAIKMLLMGIRVNPK